MSIPKIGDVVQFLHHEAAGLDHFLVVTSVSLKGDFVGLIDQGLKEVENVPSAVLKLIKKNPDGQ